MPKDTTKNIDRYKIKGGQLNEFEFQRNQEELAEDSKSDGNLIPGTPPEQRDGDSQSRSQSTKKGAGSTQSTKSSTRGPTAKKSSKTTSAAKASKATKSMPRGATAKKLAARKAAKK